LSLNEKIKHIFYNPDDVSTTSKQKKCCVLFGEELALWNIKAFQRNIWYRYCYSWDWM